MLLVSERLSLSYIQCLIGKLYEFLELQLFQITIYICEGTGSNYIFSQQKKS